MLHGRAMGSRPVLGCVGLCVLLWNTARLSV
jgi:hypothetical protein